VGFLGGQISPREGSLGRIAGRSAEPAVSRVRYVQPDDEGNVRLVVEEVRQKVLSGRADSDQIRGLLVAASREANDPGVRVETLDLLKGHSDSQEVRRALLAALQSDTNAGVRLKAIEALRGSAPDAETRRVLAQVLLTDENPGVRTQAIDLLTQRRERAMVGLLQELMTRESNEYVRLKCQKALYDMNASPEVF
jgi:HEAT repeat protein